MISLSPSTLHSPLKRPWVESYLNMYTWHKEHRSVLGQPSWPLKTKATSHVTMYKQVWLSKRVTLQHLTVLATGTLTSQGLSIWLPRPWQTSLSWTLFTWWWNDTLSQSQLLPRVYQRIWQGVDIHEVLKSWPTFLELQGMLGGCQPVTLLPHVQWLGAK